jgi:SsrA-binding protein
MLLHGLHISPYSHTSDRDLDPVRTRKLLMNIAEIRKLTGRVREKGLTLLALKLYFNPRGIVKVELGLAKGKKLHDKRDAIADRDARRDVDRALKRDRQD